MRRLSKVSLRHVWKLATAIALVVVLALCALIVWNQRDPVGKIGKPSGPYRLTYKVSYTLDGPPRRMLKGTYRLEESGGRMYVTCNFGVYEEQFLYDGTGTLSLSRSVPGRSVASYMRGMQFGRVPLLSYMPFQFAAHQVYFPVNSWFGDLPPSVKMQFAVSGEAFGVNTALWYSSNPRRDYYLPGTYELLRGGKVHVVNGFSGRPSAEYWFSGLRKLAGLNVPARIDETLYRFRPSAPRPAHVRDAQATFELSACEDGASMVSVPTIQSLVAPGTTIRCSAENGLYDIKFDPRAGSVENQLEAQRKSGKAKFVPPIKMHIRP